jgi:hypothetical protein
LPPFFKISTPTCDARGWAETTIAESAIFPIDRSSVTDDLQATKAKASKRIKRRFIIPEIG